MAAQRGGDAVTFLGVGHMGGALLRGLLQAGALQREAVQLVGRTPEALADLQRRFAVAGTLDAPAACQKARAVILGVRPPQLLPLLRTLPNGPLYISLAAGIELAALRAALPAGARCCRAMPNTPVEVGAGATALAFLPEAAAADVDFAMQLFGQVGRALRVADDVQLTAATAVSGAGPAFALLAIDALETAGAGLGLPLSTARQLAAQTFAGAGRLALLAACSPRQLQQQVMSPGGATAAGVAALAERQVAEAFAAAVHAAAARAYELAAAEPS